MRALILMLCLLCACEPSGSGLSQTTDITRACVRSFAPTLEAWQLKLGRVPKQCELLDAEYDVQLASTSEIPCEPDGENELVIGCTHNGVIYLLRGRDDLQLVDTSVHEWLHALSLCVYGTDDREHLNALLWADYGGDCVEIQAQASAAIGACL